MTVSIGHKLIGGSGMTHARFQKLMYTVHFGNVS